MDIVRNFINVIGVTSNDEFPDNMKGCIIQYSETETIYVPEDRRGIKSIFQIMLKVDVTSTRDVKTPIGSTVIFDGIRRFKIIYTETEDDGKANFLDLELPYNTFAEVSANLGKIEEVNVYILDAYFELLDSRRIYSHILYLVNINFGTDSAKKNIQRDDEFKSVLLYNNAKLDKEHNAELFIKKTPVREQVVNACTTSCSNTENVQKEERDSILVDIDAEYL